MNNEIIISQIRQRLEILYQMVDELEKSGGGGGEPGTTNYNDLTNKPSVNGHILIGSKTSSDLDLQPVISDLSTIRSGAALGATAVQPSDMEEALATLPVDQIETNKNNILSIDAIIGKQVYSAFLGRDSGTVQYQMKTNDFQTDTPDTQQCGIYIVYVINWSTTPVVSIYTVGYSGGTTGYNAATKIVGTDNLISVDENRKITYTGSGKISIYAMR